MKATVFFLIVAALFVGAIYLAAKKMGFEPEFESHLKEPVSKWRELLQGRWEYQTEFNYPREIWVFKGEVEFNADGKFNRMVTMKYYQDGENPQIEDSDLRIVAGGRVTGSWSIDTINLAWIEKIETCGMGNSFLFKGYDENFDACYWFSQGAQSIYGNKISGSSREEILTFSKDRIKIRGHDFFQDGTITRIFTKLKSY